MIQVLAGETALHPYITGYDIKVVPVETGNGFTAYDGNVIRAVSGYKTTISCTLEKVPHAVAEEIAAIVQLDEFDLTYTTPLEITKKFSCANYKAVPKCSDPREKNPLITDKITWTINLVLESASEAASSSNSL